MTETVSQSHPANRIAPWKSARPFFLIWVTIGLVPTILHLSAIGLVDTPDQDPITATQGIGAAFANTLGPWAGHIVRLVDFPNAGKNLNLGFGIVLTALVIATFCIGSQVTRRRYVYPLYTVFGLLMIVWYGYGFLLIAAGLL